MPPHGEERGFQSKLLEVVEPKTIEPQFPGRRVYQINIDIPPSTRQPKQIQSHQPIKKSRLRDSTAFSQFRHCTQKRRDAALDVTMCISTPWKELASAIVVLLSIRVGRIIGAFISLMDDNTIRLWLTGQQDAAKRLAQHQAAAFQTQIEALRAELQVATGVLQTWHGGGSDQGSLLPRFKRLDVPKFSGVDPESWLFSINEYFTLLNTPADQRLRIVGFNPEGAAAEWFCWMTRNGLITDWPRVTDISETLLISFYISGLKLPLQRELLVSKPTTPGDAFALACVTEARLDDQGTVAVALRLPVPAAGHNTNVQDQL
nr:prolyl oligopeptidase family protein [Tanacetum cinerariifolium]